MAEALQELVAGVELLCLDAGNTLIFLDHARIGRELRELGFAAETAALIAAEGAAKRGLEDVLAGAPSAVWNGEWAHASAPGARGWGMVIGTTIWRGGGVPEQRVAEVLGVLWDSHLRWNLYSLVPEDLRPAMAKLRATGVKSAIISNSEGMLAELFTKLGILGDYDLLVDSGIFGVEKPDARIFRVAFEHFGVRPESVLHLGDTYATDVAGARVAGARAALIDPFDHYPGLHLDVPRVKSVAEVVDAIAAARIP